MKPQRRRTGADAVVEEVRAIRRALWRRGGGTVKGYLQLMDRMGSERDNRPPAKPRARRRKSA